MKPLIVELGPRYDQATELRAKTNYDFFILILFFILCTFPVGFFLLFWLLKEDIVLTEDLMEQKPQIIRANRR